MRILITGSRTWMDTHQIRDYLEWHTCLENTEITLIHGDCPRGADFIANELAIEFEWKIEKHPADWRKHGKRAGFLRNAEMVERGADICLAFIKNKSRGATMCADLAEAAGIPTVRIME